jgi:large conductance mechanosensitive channel
MPPERREPNGEDTWLHDGARCAAPAASARLTSPPGGSRIAAIAACDASARRAPLMKPNLVFDDPQWTQMADTSRLFQSSGGNPMLKEFKEFAMRGNVLDMAVGIVIGAAFGRIVSSFVEDVLMPPVGMLLGKVDFSNLFVVLGGQSFDTLKAARDAGAPVVAYGAFFNHIFNFLIVAFAIFLLVKNVNRLKREQAPAPAAPSTRECPYCCSTIAIKATKCPNCTSALGA